MSRFPLFCLPFLFVATALSQTTHPASGPTTGPAKTALDREVAHLAHVEKRLAKHPKLAGNPYVRLEISLAHRFINRVATGQGIGDPELEWKILQMDEVGYVLKHTEQTLDMVEAKKTPEEGLGPVPTPTGGPVKIVDGVFVTDTTTPDDSIPKPRPFYFGGYGHFQQIVNDLPNFPALGVTLVQDGRNGPDQGLGKDRKLAAAGLDIKTTLDKAAVANIKMDILTSPHYFPGWAVAEAPDMANGTAFNNIDHPKQREVIETYLKLIGQQNKNESSLFSYCLSNEPVYSASGRDKYSTPVWHAFLKDRHKTIDALNALYETKYKSFDEVPADGWPANDVGQRHAFDWVCFNDQHFAAWHKWMGDVLRQQDPRVLTSAKIMVFFSLDADKLGWGIDPEQFAAATDIAGCDAYSQMLSGTGPLDESAPDDYAYHWQVEEMCYDLLHSFRNQPVFNSENHPIANATGAYRFPSRQSRAAIWQGGLHHQGATTTWVWEEAHEPSLLHSIYYRPAYCWGQQRALLDLNRLGDEVTAINRAKPTVAIVYSPASRFWEKDYAPSMRTIYTALDFLGQTITFVSEKQLAEGKIPDVAAIVLPHATHVTNGARVALTNFQSKGGTLVAAGDHCLAFDEYNRPREGGLTSAVSLKTERGAASDLRKAFKSPASVAVVDAKTIEPAWGVEYKVVESDGATLVPLINLLKQPQTVNVTTEQADSAIDLLTGQPISLKKITLEPMTPLLLKISAH